MAMDIGNPYADWYYGDEYYDVEVPEPTPGGGGEGGMTPEEVQQAIDNALDGIVVGPKDEDTTQVIINGNETDIDDVYLQNVTVDENGDDAIVNFHMSNGRDPIQVNRSDFNDPNIDCSTF